MKKSLRILAFILTLFMFVSCGKEPVDNQNDDTTSPIIRPDIEKSDEPLTEKKEADRSYEYLYKDNPGLIPVDYENPAILPETEDMGQEYIDKLMILCDSQHYWMKPFGFLKDGEDTKNIITGPEGTMTLTYYRELDLLDPYDGGLKNVVEIMKEHKPEYLVVALGLNGVATSDAEGFQKDYRELIEDIQRVSPDTQIICESILPIMTTYRYWGSITNVKITECNSWILKIAEEHGCRYLDTYGVIADGNGNADPSLMMDNLHANKEGLRKVLKYWRTHAVTESLGQLG